MFDWPPASARFHNHAHAVARAQRNQRFHFDGMAGNQVQAVALGKRRSLIGLGNLV